MLLLLALILAFPTCGVSLIAYFVWMHYAKKGSQSDHQPLSKVGRAILLVANKHNGSIIGTSVEGVTYNEVTSELLNNMLFTKERYERIDDAVEADITLHGQKYDVHVTREPNGGKDAILRVRKSEKWLDDLYKWMHEELGIANGTSKYYLVHDATFWAGAAHRPEDRPREPVKVPASLGNLTHLKTLALINRNVVSLPESLRKLRNLKELKLGGNCLTKFPNQVFDMPNLELLTLWFNDIEEVPSDIGKLVTLKGLDLSGNQFKNLPDSITNLTRLEKFYMTHDGVVELTRAQKIWLVELIKSGAEVCLNKEADDDLMKEFPELAHVKRVKEEFDPAALDLSEFDN